MTRYPTRHIATAITTATKNEMMSVSGLPSLFRDMEAWRTAFVRGLDEMLAQEQLGSFILVLANAVYAPAIHAQLRPRLARRFTEFSGRYRELLAGGRPLPAAPDDLLVLLKLMVVGFDALQPTVARALGVFEVQFNHLRAFRPPRMTDAVVDGVYRPFDDHGFHFNKPFLMREVLWEGRIDGRHMRWLYNKFPFAPWHSLLVIEPAQERPQWLDAADVEVVWQLARRLAPGLPGVGFGYNAYGAYASVNHQHFQMFVRDVGRYPVESMRWRHNGGGHDYPSDCIRCDDMATLEHILADLHAANRTYNLLLRPGCCYVLPRALQGSYRHSAWTGGFAWAELAGSLTTFNRDDYEAVTEAMLHAEYACLAGNPSV